MPGKDFEQQVRETLGPWRLEPSANVWGRLEEDLARRKKRRRAFYLFLLAGLLAGGALFRFGLDGQDGPRVAGESASLQDAHQQAKGGMIQPDRESTGMQQPQSGSKVAQTGQGTVDPSARKADAAAGIQGMVAHAPAMDQSSGPVARRARTAAPSGKNMPGADDLSRPDRIHPEQQGRSAATPLDAGRDDAEAPGAVSDEPTHVQANRSIETLSAGPRDHSDYPSPFAGQLSRLPVPQNHFSTPVNGNGDAQAGNQTEKYTRKNTIRFGLNAGLGRSAFTEGLGVSSAKSTNVNAGPSTGGGSGNPTPVYDYRQDPSTGWELGLWMQKSISRRWHFSAGLSYIQFSTRTPVGQYLGDTARLYNNGTRDQVSVTGYSGGSQSDYINRYHILQVPLSFGWQMNQGRKLPITLTMGLNPGYLLSSNALVRDSAQALYNHPDNQRKFQLGFRSGLHVRLMPSSTHPLDIGPVVQYQLNQVFIDGNRDNGHLYYLGVEARIPIFSVSGKQR